MLSRISYAERKPQILECKKPNQRQNEVSFKSSKYILIKPCPNSPINQHTAGEVTEIAKQIRNFLCDKLRTDKSNVNKFDGFGIVKAENGYKITLPKNNPLDDSMEYLLDKKVTTIDTLSEMSEDGLKSNVLVQLYG